ncbi:hypothetical protein [Nonomuraea cavernae]|uniref:hypothetical protein n=1 Tax=Nonomuraea cavernae TaxID=2045107 RepID=UPI0016640C9A|nr:hypothetical protein [Nonomuraea cavernae]MCA2190595.1 hypothetical protein [Nonomuraea cavernae]
MLDTVLALLIVAALPLAIVAIPNTVSVVGALLPEGFDRLELMRAHGLALPAMILTVPLASVALGRMRVAYVLVGGLALLAVADAAGGYAGSTFLVGVLRVLHGIGAGLLIPATLVAVWQRPPVLRAIWTGMLALSLLAAQALALWPLDGIHDWKVTLQPYPMLTGIALGLAAAYLVVWQLHGRQPAAAPRASERSRLLLATVPAAGISVLAISTATDDWRANLVILVAVLAVGALLALASTGTREGRTFAYTMVAVGTVLLPSVAQVTYVEMKGLGGPGLKGLWIPFVVAGLLAVAAAVVVRLFAGAATRWLTPLGLLTMVVGLCAVRVVVPAQQGLVMVVPLTLLAVGAAVAVTAALGRAGLGSALFGLALCFPGVLAGYLLGTGVQMAMLRGVTSTQELVDRFVGALHLWALIGGFVVVVVILLASLLARRASVSADGSSAAGGRADEIDPVPVPDEAVAVPSGEDAAGRDASASGGQPGIGVSRRGKSPSTAADAAVEPAHAPEGDESTGVFPRVSPSVISEALTSKAAGAGMPAGGGRSGAETRQVGGTESSSQGEGGVAHGGLEAGGSDMADGGKRAGGDAVARGREGVDSPGDVKAGAFADGREEMPPAKSGDEEPGSTSDGERVGRSGAGRGNAEGGRGARPGSEASVPRQGGPEQGDAPESTGPLPPVPPPTPSPEDNGSP